MTFAEIKAMFKIGQVWTVTRSRRREVRTLRGITSTELEWRLSDGRTRIMPFPEWSTIVQARPGYVEFTYPNGITMSLEIVQAAKE